MSAGSESPFLPTDYHIRCQGKPRVSTFACLKDFSGATYITLVQAGKSYLLP